MKKIKFILLISFGMFAFSCNSGPSAKKMAEEYCRLVEEYNNANKVKDMPRMEKALADRKAVLEKVGKGHKDGDQYIMTFVKETNGCRDEAMLQQIK